MPKSLPEWFIEKMKESPFQAFQLASHLAGIPSDLFEQADDLFSRVKRIDIDSIGTKREPGIIIIFDQKLSIWLYKKGESYIYDGFEIGDYGEPEIPPPTPGLTV